VSHFRWTDRAVNRFGLESHCGQAGRNGRRACCAGLRESGNGLIFQLAHGASQTPYSASRPELLNKRGRRVESASRPDPAGQAAGHPDSARAAGYLRWRTYLLANREGYKPRTNLPLFRRRESSESIAATVPAANLAAEIAALPEVAH